MSQDHYDMTDFGFRNFGDSWMFQCEYGQTWFSTTSNEIPTAPQMVQYALIDIAKDAHRNGYEKAVITYMAAEYKLHSRIAEYVRTGIETDGAHHKQWCLMQIAKVLELQGIDTLDEGTAP